MAVRSHEKWIDAYEGLKYFVELKLWASDEDIEKLLIMNQDEYEEMLQHITEDLVDDGDFLKIISSKIKI